VGVAIGDVLGCGVDNGRVVDDGVCAGIGDGVPGNGDGEIVGYGDGSGNGEIVAYGDGNGDGEIVAYGDGSGVAGT